MRGEIRRICKDAGLTAIYVTHDQKEALSVGDHIAVMEGGHIRQTGTPLDIYRKPATRFVADFMGETNFIEGKVSALSDGHISVETALAQFTAVAQSPPPAVGAMVLLSIRPEAWRLSVEPSAVNSVPGRIRERVYLGEMAQYRFATRGQLVKIYELNPRFAFTADDRDIFASVEPQDVVALAV